MRVLFDRFAADDKGAVTVDWVVLTAGIVGLAIAIVIALRPAIIDITNDLNTALASDLIDTTL